MVLDVVAAVLAVAVDSATMVLDPSVVGNDNGDKSVVVFPVLIVHSGGTDGSSGFSCS